MSPKYSLILCFFIGIIFLACSEENGQIDDINGNLPDTQNIALGSLAPYNQSSYSNPVQVGILFGFDQTQENQIDVEQTLEMIKDVLESLFFK